MKNLPKTIEIEKYIELQIVLQYMENDVSSLQIMKEESYCIYKNIFFGIFYMQMNETIYVTFNEIIKIFLLPFFCYFYVAKE